MRKLLILFVCILFSTSVFAVQADDVDLRICNLDFHQMQSLVADENCSTLDHITYSKAFSREVVLNPSSFTEAENKGKEIFGDHSFYQEILKEHNVIEPIDGIYIINYYMYDSDVLIKCGENVYWVWLDCNIEKNDAGDYEFVIHNTVFGTKEDFDNKYSLVEGKMYGDRQPSVDDPFYLYNDETLIPMRTMVESMGATVYWSPIDGSITITAKDAEYICYINDEHYITMRSTNGKETDCVMLGSMSASGYCYMINDRTYLSEKTAMKLMYELGHKLNINKESLTCYVEKNK